MNPITTSSLFHFTKKIETLKLILKNGLRYTYSAEKYPIEIVKNLLMVKDKNISKRVYPYIAFPLISFCDTPLTRVSAHAKIYGKYFIGIDKEFINVINSSYLNPLLYANADAIINTISDLSRLPFFISEQQNAYIHNNFDKFFEFIEGKKDLLSEDNLLSLVPIDYQNLLSYKMMLDKRILQLLALYKPIKGSFRRKTDYYFIDEREWRAFLPNDCAEWKYGVSQQECERNREKWTENLIDNKHRFFQIRPQFYSFISHIAVSREDERLEIIQYILDSDELFGYLNKTDKNISKNILISKITSFERIENDY